jgi:hypothetical protein
LNDVCDGGDPALGWHVFMSFGRRGIATEKRR